MMGLNICFDGEIWKIISKLPYPFHPFLSGALWLLDFSPRNQSLKSRSVLQRDLGFWDYLKDKTSVL